MIKATEQISCALVLLLNATGLLYATADYKSMKDFFDSNNDGGRHWEVQAYTRIIGALKLDSVQSLSDSPSICGLSFGRLPSKKKTRVIISYNRDCTRYNPALSLSLYFDSDDLRTVRRKYSTHILLSLLQKKLTLESTQSELTLEPTQGELFVKRRTA